MKLRMLVIAAVFSALAVASSADDRMDPVKFCDMLGGLADAVMTARQAGVVMSQAMSVLADDEDLSPIVQKLVISAYGTPQFSVEANRRDAVIRFRNDFEYECFRGVVE